jgi:Cu+-exporting ATPase
MHCAACAQTVERALKARPGVSRANVNLATERALVWFDPQMVRLEELRQAVEEAGYRVAQAEEALGQEVHRAAHLRRRMWSAWTLVTPITLWMVTEMVTGVKWPTPLVFDLGMLLLAGPVLFWAGREILRSGLLAGLRRVPNMDTLIMLGTVTAYATGLVALFSDLGWAPIMLDYSGVAAMAFSSINVVTNANRLRRVRI